MAIDYRYTDDGRGMIFTGRGVVDREQFDRLDTNTAIHDVKLLYMISDLRGVDSMDLSTGEIRGIAEADLRKEAYKRDIVLAIVGESDIVYGLARMYQAFVDEASWKVKVFRDLEAAKAWINEQTRQGLGREMTFA